MRSARRPPDSARAQGRSCDLIKHGEGLVTLILSRLPALGRRVKPRTFTCASGRIGQSRFRWAGETAAGNNPSGRKDGGGSVVQAQRRRRCGRNAKTSQGNKQGEPQAGGHDTASAMHRRSPRRRQSTTHHHGSRQMGKSVALPLAYRQVRIAGIQGTKSETSGEGLRGIPAGTVCTYVHIYVVCRLTSKSPVLLASKRSAGRQGLG